MALRIHLCYSKHRQAIIPSRGWALPFQTIQICTVSDPETIHLSELAGPWTGSEWLGFRSQGCIARYLPMWQGNLEFRMPDTR